MSTSPTVVIVLPGKASASAVRLVSAAESAPKELEAVLLELGAGNSRFNGTSFGRGECDLPAFLQECRDAEDAAIVPDHLVPQSTYWLVDNSDKAVRLLRAGIGTAERLRHGRVAARIEMYATAGCAAGAADGQPGQHALDTRSPCERRCAVRPRD